MESTYTADEEYAISQINQFLDIKGYVDSGCVIVFDTSEDIIDGMSGLQIDVYGRHYSNSDNASLLNIYFMDYETRELYVMDRLSGEYFKVE